MIRNYFVTALRNIWRNRTFSLINILGLAIGISASLVIFLIVHYELSYDTFEKDGNQIYRVVLNAKFNGQEGHSAGVQAPLSAAIANEMTGIELTVPIMEFQGDGSVKVTVARSNANAVIFKKQTGVAFTNAAYFQLLPYQWLAGSSEGALKDPFSVVLSEQRARNYFPNTAIADIVGKKIIYNDNLPVTVSGIVKDLKENTSLASVEFISFATIAKTNLQDHFMMNTWNDWMIYSQLYVKLARDATVAEEEKQLRALMQKYNSGANKTAGNSMAFHLQPLSDIHFNPVYTGLGQRVANEKTLYGLLTIAGFLLLLGCINFINLTTAQASRRAKEIGIRKTMGSSKTQLVFQFLGETFCLTFISTLLSLALTPLLLNMFRNFIPEGLELQLLQQPAVLVFLLILILTVSFLSGLYPAMVLSGYKPVQVLKDQYFVGKSPSRSVWLRKSLTVSQFVIAQFFVIATVMVSRQINYSLNADMGFNKDAVVTFEQPRDSVKTHHQQLLNAIRSIPGVAMASTGFMPPASNGVAYVNVSYYNGKQEIHPALNIQLRWGDPEYINVYKIPLVAGRNVLASDTIREFLINEKYARALGFQQPRNAIGQQLKWNDKYAPIVGIMKDFHDISLRGAINAVIFGGSPGSTFHVKLLPSVPGGHTWKNAIAGMQAAYKSIYPEETFEYHFIDDNIAKLYTAEQHTASLLTWATGLAVFISCLGLLGLVIYTTTTRTKEIGIRKILGAPVTAIISLLSKDFVRLVLLAFVIAAPLAWWVMSKWLQQYAYRTTLSWWVFAASGLGMLAVAMLTLGMQTIRTAVASPVKSLRTE